MVKILIRVLTVVFALLLVARFVPGFAIDSLYTALIVALLLGLINITIKPILFILTLPFTLLTFGLFAFVLNGVILWFVASFVDGFEITGFLPALIGAVIISFVSWAVNKLS